ncbi:hypothetical protein J4218_05365 [Candidatus Pacearchaeota archaeon]|nr:hypothetical protein [Candidatus Pacearchaeota archaeon]
MENRVKITFDDSMKKDILRIFGKAVNEHDIIVEANNPSQKVKTKDNEEITLKQFAGIKYGSEIFVKKDIVSLLDLAKGE